MKKFQDYLNRAPGYYNYGVASRILPLYDFSRHTQQIEVWPEKAAIFLTICRIRFQVNTQLLL